MDLAMSLVEVKALSKMMDLTFFLKATCMAMAAPRERPKSEAGYVFPQPDIRKLPTHPCKGHFLKAVRSFYHIPCNQK
jgi:hypothetical protein